MVKLNKKVNLKDAFYSLCSLYPNAFVYLTGVGEELWIGATPEILLYRNGLAVQSLSLAGTIRNQAGGSFTSKEVNEQEIVTSYITDIFQDYATKTEVEAPGELEAGSIRHLATKINGNLKDHSLFGTLVEALHPTPAVGGYPKRKAVDFILNTENYERGYYTGYIGYQEKEKSRLYVNLRCGQLFSDAVLLYAGGGIVKGSSPAKEWQETVEKMKTIGQLFEGS
jgi:isochorismate synthase